MNLNALLTNYDSVLNDLELDVLSRIVIDDDPDEVYRLVLLALRRSRGHRIDAARREWGAESKTVANPGVANLAPKMFSQSMLAALQAASGEGMFLHFMNASKAIMSGSKSEEMHGELRQRVEVLDKAQDAILVQDLNCRVIYWNKSAERLYGWRADEMTGRVLVEIVRDAIVDMSKCATSVSPVGEWRSELSLRHRDGSTLIVESRSTLMRGEDGEPRSILSISTDITDRRAAETKIHRLAFFDSLTGLPNRLLLLERLEKALRTAVRQGCMGAIFFIDLDDFKMLDDTLGQDKGDLLLQQIAQRLLACGRSGDTVSRFGSDEFVVIMEGLSEDAVRTTADAQAFGDKLLAVIRRALEVGNFEYNCTASIGVALFPGWCDSAEDLLKRLDLAMYRMKGQARNGICFFDPEMQNFVAPRAALLSDLRHAVKNRAFELFYQPQVDRKRNVTGAEGFLRWQHPRGGIVPPNQFIPLAKQADLMGDLDRWVLETACAEMSEWSARPEMGLFGLTVNVSVRQLLDSRFLNLVREVLRESRINPERLILEITEEAATENIGDTLAQMTALRECGIRFSLDHFGTGHCSVSSLARLPLNQLKIDRSFVKDVLTDVKAAAHVRTIIALGKSLNLAIIAEGVDTEGECKFLEKEGCYTYQGNLFAPAMPFSQLKAFVAQARLLRGLLIPAALVQ